MNEVVSSTQNIYPINRVSLFGILSSTVNEKEECHFCLEEIIKDELLTMDTPCCNHAVHCECFKKWKGTSFYRTGNEYTTVEHRFLSQTRVSFTYVRAVTNLAEKPSVV